MTGSAITKKLSSYWWWERQLPNIFPAIQDRNGKPKKVFPLFWNGNSKRSRWEIYRNEYSHLCLGWVNLIVCHAYWVLDLKSFNTNSKKIASFCLAWEQTKQGVDSCLDQNPTAYQPILVRGAFSFLYILIPGWVHPSWQKGRNVFNSQSYLSLSALIEGTFE